MRCSQPPSEPMSVTCSPFTIGDEAHRRRGMRAPVDKCFGLPIVRVSPGAGGSFGGRDAAAEDSVTVTRPVRSRRRGTMGIGGKSSIDKQQATSSHGKRRPTNADFASQQVDRRFSSSRRGRSCLFHLPVACLFQAPPPVTLWLSGSLALNSSSHCNCRHATPRHATPCLDHGA